MFSLAIIYESGKRYIVPFEILEEVVPLTEEQKKILEEKIKLEIQKQ